MKMKKFLAVILLVAMCASFMAVSASASENGFNISDFDPDVDVVAPEPEVTPSEPEVTPSEPEVTPSESGNADVIIGQNADISIFEEPENGSDEKAPAEKKETKDNKLKETTVAVIGDKQFDTLEAAIKASVKGDTIKFVKNIEVSSVVLKTKNMTLDLNGHTLSFIVGKGEKNQDGSFSGHPYCMDVQRNTKIVNGTVAIVADADVEGAFLQQNPIIVEDGVTLNFLANLQYDETAFAGTQFSAFGGSGTVLDGTEKENDDRALPLDENAEPGQSETDALSETAESETAESETTESETAESETTESETAESETAESGEAEFPILLNGKTFANFKEAFANANDGDTLELLRSTTGTAELEVAKKLTFKLNGFTVGNPGINVAEGAELTVINGTVKDINAKGTVTLGENASAGDINVTEKGKLNVNAATASVNKVTGAKEAMNITAGSFKADPSASLGDNYTASEKDGTWVVSEKANVAEVNGTGYKTIGEAVNAVAEGQTGTVTVKANVSENLTISGRNIVLDLGGNTLNGSITVNEGAGLTVQNGKVGDITVNGELTIADKNVTAGKVTAGEKAKLNITAGTFNNDKVKVNPEYTLVDNKDGTFTVVEKATLNPDSAKHLKGTDAGLKVTASEDITSVSLKKSDGNTEVIDPKFYDLSENDKKIITFHADWLNQLIVGEYEIVFTLADSTKTFKLTVDTDTQVKLDPASFTYVKGEAEDTVFTVNQPVTGKVMFGDEELSAEKDFTLDENKTALTLKADFLNSSNPGSFELKVSTDYGEALAAVTVQTSVTVDPASQNFEHQSTKDVTFTVTSTEDITSVSENDAELTKDTDYSINGKKLIFSAEYLNKLSVDSHEFVVRTAHGSAKLTIEIVYSKTSVTDASGKEISELKHFKGNSSMNNEFKFKTTPELAALSVDDKTLTEGEDYEVLSNGDIRIAKDAKFLSNLSAGQHTLSFKLKNDATVDIKLLIYPSVKFSSTRYNKGSNTDIEITVSDMADNILYGSELKNIEDNYWTYDSENGKYIIDSKFFEAQPEGDLTLGLRYGEMSFTLNGFKVNGNATIKPYNYVDKDGKSVWPYGSDTLGFKVEPDVKGVTIDGTELSSKQYSVDKNGILWIAASKLQKLEYGRHSIVVDTSYGEADTEFYTKVGIEPKNEDYHVKGGSKNLSFISSEPVNEVYVGREPLKSSYYTLSKDRMTVTLTSAFMNRLKADVTYTLTVKTDEGSAACNFRILSPESAASIPKTGDESNILIWAAVMLLSGATVVALIPRKKKN